MSSGADQSGTQNSPLRSSFASDPDMGELVELFVEEMPQRVQAIASAFDQGQAELLGRISHQLKGASAGYGFDVIGQAAAVVEAQVKTLAPGASLESVKAQVDALIALCNRVAK